MGASQKLPDWAQRAVRWLREPARFPVRLLAAIEAAQLKCILTSRRFVEAAKFEETVMRLGQKAKIVYLEDLRDGKVKGRLVARIEH